MVVVLFVVLRASNPGFNSVSCAVYSAELYKTRSQLYLQYNTDEMIGSGCFEILSCWYQNKQERKVCLGDVKDWKSSDNKRKSV